MVYGLCNVVAGVPRPLAIALLAPAIVATSVAILLGLLGVFVLWLSIVAVLITAIVVADIGHRFMRRLSPTSLGSLERPAVGVPGR